MPPHCDSMDGPVVTAARRAIAAHDVDLVLPFVKASGEREVTAAFERTLAARDGDSEVNEVADLYFFETVVRVHRAGEGAPYTGLKPAGLPTGPAIPLAERAVETGDVAELRELLTVTLQREITQRLDHVRELSALAGAGVGAARAYTEAALGFEVWAHGLYGAMTGPVHGEAGAAEMAELHGH